MRRRTAPALPWLAGLLCLYIVAPLIAGLSQLGLADWRGVEWTSLGWACAVSVMSATLATALVTVTGVPLGFLLARAPGRALGLIGFVVQLPLALPPLASGILLLFLLGYASPIGALTNGALTDSFVGIVLAEAFVAAPFLVIAARSAFARQDPLLEDVAATLGHRPWGVFRLVSLPLAGRAILAGALLAWLRAFGEFGATVMVAYHPYSLPVYTYVAFGGQGLPAMLPVLLPTLLAALAVMGVASFVGEASVRRGRTAPTAEPDSTRKPPSPIPCRPPPAGPIEFAFHRQLEGFSLDVAWRTGARRLAILGASGSGKSMTLRALAGVDRAHEGRFVLGGRDLFALEPERRGISYVPQNYGLFPHLSVTQQLGFAVDADAALAEDWMERLGLSQLRRRLPGELSLGQQQRVALARAFSRRTPLLLLDEPFSALDAPLRAQLRRELRGLQDEIDATTILVTHDPEEAFLLADEIMVLENGRVLRTGSVAEVYARPGDDVAARLLGADNAAYGLMVEGNRIEIGARVRLEIAGAGLPAGMAVGWSVRAENVRLGRDGRYDAIVLDIALRPGQCVVDLQLGQCRVRAAASPGAGVGLGPCRVDIDPEAIQVWPAPAILPEVTRPTAELDGDDPTPKLIPIAAASPRARAPR